MTAELAEPMRAGHPSRPDFPVHWDRPEDAELFWEHDRLHFPYPVTPLDNDFIERLYHSAFNGAAASYDLPISAHTWRINTYHYLSMAPLPLPPEELEALGKRAEQKIGAATARLEEFWEQEWLPEVKRHLAYWREYDLAAASLPALLEHLEESVARFERVWLIHFQAAMPFLMGPSLFEELYRDLFGGKALDAYRLLQGFDNKSLETDRAIWALSRRALAQPAIKAVFEQRPADQVVAALSELPEGRDFLVALDACLDEYGRRTSQNGVLSTPSWLEDPTTVITNIKDYLGQPERDALAEMAALAEERERAVAEARERLRSYPAAVRQHFEELLRAAQYGSALSETHAYWIDYAASYEVRQVLVEFGRRFAAAGVLERSSDVFLLTLDELRETAEALPSLDRRALVAERQAEIDHFAQVEPIPALGTPPPGPPGDPIGRAVMRFFGGPPPASASPDEIRGNPGSAGQVRGTARVILSLADAGRLQPGEILVTTSTQPAWTPLFATAAAVVTDSGGVLSHCAVVAREYRIPAVVGTGRATSTIRDGQTIEVDGSAGVIKLLA